MILGALERLDALGLGPDDYRLDVFGLVEDRAQDVLAAHPCATAAGFYGPEHMSTLFTPYHAGIVASVWEENYGFVGVEMLAAGLPVIGNAIGGITDYVIDGETGWRNESLDGDGLAAIMAALVRDPAQVEARSRDVVARRAELVKPFALHVEEIDALYAAL